MIDESDRQDDVPPVQRLPAELLRAVFDRLDGPSVDAAIIVCRRWSTVAVHMKWSTRTVPFSALVSLLGEVKLETDDEAWCDSDEESDESGDLITFQDIAQHHIANFKEKAAIVTAISISSIIPHRLFATILPIFSGSLPVFPQLTTFSALVHPDAAYTLVPFLNGNVHTLRLVGERSRYRLTRGALNDNLRQLIAKCPAIRSLVVEGYLEGSWDLAMAFPDLIYLSFHGIIAITDLISLSRSCPRLTRLYVSADTESRANVNTPVTSEVATFPSLEVVDDLHTSSEASGAVILSNMNMPSLRQMNIRVWPHRLSEYVHLIAPRAPLLERLSMDYRPLYAAEEVQDLPYPETNITWAVFKDLQSLKLAIDDADPVRTATMTDMFPPEMPALEELSLLCDAEQAYRPNGINFKSLANLAASIKTLKRLETVVNASAVGQEASLSESLPSSASVEQLVLSPIFVPHKTDSAVAILLRLIFPKVSIFRPTIIYHANGVLWQSPHDVSNTEFVDTFFTSHPTLAP